jgi:TRAP transporter TAXI family solute receptor
LNKKLIAVLLVIVVIVVVGAAYWILTKPTGIEEQKPVKLKFVTQTKGTSWYVFGASFADLLQKSLPPGSTVEVISIPATAGLPMVAKGEADMCISYPSLVKWALEGVETYEGQKVPDNLRILAANLDIYWVAFGVRKDIGITSIKQIVDQKYPLRLVVWTKGSMGEFATRKIFQDVYGISYKDIESWGGKVTFTSSMSTAIELIQNNQADAFFHNSNPGHPGWTELATTRDIRFLPLSEEELKALEKTGVFVRSIMPAGTFRGIERDIPTIGFATCLVVRADLPKDLVFTIMKTLIENRDKLIAAYPPLEAFKPENAGKGIPVPLHPGAEAYLKSKGYI